MLRFLFRLMYGARRPIVSGEIIVRGLEKPVVIRRDKYGVPHIDAQTDTDAAFALGFVQAQDRAGQLETYQRIIRGTLAELVGAPGLPTDKLTRRIGFRRVALQQLNMLSADIRAFIDAFTEGINAGYQVGSKHWPHEFALLKSTPSPWDTADVLGYVKFMSFQLPSNWDIELARFIMLREDGPDAMIALDPVVASACGMGSEAKEHASLEMLIRELKVLNEYAPRGGGSNNWVVAGSRSTSGKPVLAGDPHLGPTLPNPWYLAHIHTPTWSVAGATFAGSPVFPIAHNGFACWSVTAGLTDTTDLFLETLSADGKQAKQPDGTWLDCEIVRETIRVKGGADVVEEVVITPRGPIVTPLIPDEKLAISLKAVWLQPRPMRGFFESVRAKSFAEFREPLAAWPVLPLNLLYADETGTIGYQLMGDIPVRSGGNGLLPTPVANGDWIGYVPFDAMPTMTNPDCGYIATANSDPHSWCPPAANPPPLLGFDYIDAYRAETIRDELAKRTDWSAEAFRQLQLSQRSMPWEAIRDIVLALSSNDSDAAMALAELRDWDGQVAIDSPAAAVYELFISEMCNRTAKAKAPNCWRMAIGGSGEGPFANSLLADRRVRHLVHLIQTRPDGWFAGGWNAEMITALAAGVKRLRDEAGPSPPYWAWGHRRMLRLRHPLLGKHWLLGRIFNLGPVPLGGDANTIAQAGCRPLTPFAETHNFPNLRSSFDVANWSNCRFALAGGQSGNPCSPNFADQFPLWQRGEGIPIAWTSDEVIKSAVTALQLRPAI